MGHLFLINDSFELAGIDVDKRDAVFIEFCKAVDLAKKDGDRFYSTSDIHSRQFSYGTLFYDFFYKSWSEIRKDSNLRGISNTALQLFPALLYAMPSLVTNIDSQETFDSQFTEVHKALSGFKMEGVEEPYICCERAWILWKIDWLLHHQDEIKWRKEMDDFLPNKAFSDAVLSLEIIKHKKSIELTETEYAGKPNKDALIFHEKVMAHKGSGIPAYTQEIGGLIAGLNYYVYDDRLSKAEQEKAKSLRNIYRLTNKYGRNQYISLDHKHGMFEYHDHTGKHLGEKHFDGSHNSPADPTHDLKTL